VGLRNTTVGLYRVKLNTSPKDEADFFTAGYWRRANPKCPGCHRADALAAGGRQHVSVGDPAPSIDPAYRDASFSELTMLPIIIDPDTRTYAWPTTSHWHALARGPPILTIADKGRE
jgi:hypothetical protein